MSHNSDLKNIADFWKCLSQGFGSNPEMYKPFGIIAHNGIDFGYEDVTPVYSSHDGVANTGEDSNKGLGVTVTDSEKKTIYWHFKSFSVRNGQTVKTGDLLGYGDSTGFSTGPHLHYGLKLLDSSGNVLNRDNGYDGAIDPTPFLCWPDNTMTEKEVLGLQALEGYNDPDGIKYWTGKTLQQYLDVRLADKIKELQQAQ